MQTLKCNSETALWVLCPYISLNLCLIRGHSWMLVLGSYYWRITWGCGCSTWMGSRISKLASTFGLWQIWIQLEITKRNKVQQNFKQIFFFRITKTVSSQIPWINWFTLQWGLWRRRCVRIYDYIARYSWC